MHNPSSDLTRIRAFLKERLQRDVINLCGHSAERKNIADLLQRTAELGESNSLLLIGSKGVGKTTLVNTVLVDLLLNKDFRENTLIVYLDGNLHTDDRLALKSATVQMHLENATDGKVFGSFAENLAFLLACLKAGNRRSKSVIFILNEFDLFCTHHNQTLLYNLFDVSQSAQAPICVLGITCRLDVVELLEKRVKSRFSHRQVFLFPNANDFDGHVENFQRFLSIPSEGEMKSMSDRTETLKLLQSDELVFRFNHFNPSKYKFQKRTIEMWNKSIEDLIRDKTVLKSLQSLYDFDVSLGFLKTFIFQLVSQLNQNSRSRITPEQIAELIKAYDIDDKVELLFGLSVIEICLVIAIKHHSQIYDCDPFNFEMIFSRFMKFAKVSSSMQGIERAVLLKAFEHLRNLEFILPLSGASCKVQKEFEMHKLALTYGQINHAAQNYQALPTEVAQWAQSSVI